MANRIRDLENEMPIANNQAARNVAAANAIKMQQGMGQMTQAQAVAGGPSLAQQAGAEVAQQQAAVNTAQAQAEAQRDVQGIELDYNAMKIDEEKRHIMEAEQRENRRIDNEMMLAKLGSDIQEKVLNDRMNFQSTERGVTFGSQRQLAHYTAMQAKNLAEYQKYEQDVLQAHETEMQMYDEAYKVYEMREKQMFKSGEAALDRESVNRVRAKKEEIARRRRAAQKRHGFQTKVIGAATVVAGAFITGASFGGAGVVGASMMAQGAKTYSEGEQKSN